MPPPIRERLIRQLKMKGMPMPNAQRIATATLQKAGDLKPGSTEPTAKGIKRTAMGAAGRAKDRASKEAGKPASSFKYNPRTNRATLGEK
jgi:hypothetical protein